MDSLSYSEKLVLFALSAFTESSDREIAEKLGLRNSTFTAIKNRLKKQGYFRMVKLPVFYRLGYELFCTTYGHFRKTPDIEKIISDGGDISLDFIIGAGHNFYMAVEYNQFLFMLFCKDFKSMYSTYIDFIKRFTKMGIMGVMDVNTALLPFKNMYIYNMFNSAPLLYKKFGFDKDDRFHETLSKKDLATVFPKWEHISVETRNLTSMELRTLYTICKFPMTADNKLSAIIGAARQTVTRIKKNLISNGLLRTILIPDFQKLGYSIFVFVHAYIRPDIEMKKRFQMIEPLIKDLPPYLMITQGEESIIYIPFTTYGEYKRASNLIYELYKEKELLQDKPKIIEFSLENMWVFRDHAYHYCL